MRSSAVKRNNLDGNAVFQDNRGGDLAGMYNFNALECFVAVARQGNFKLAAESLNRSQSAVSAQIRQFENQLGLTLFHRTTRRVNLTREGELLLFHARRALAELDLGLREIRRAVKGEAGTVSFACVPSIASSVLPSLLQIYKGTYPNVGINLRELHGQHLLEAVRSQEVDFAIGPLVAGYSDLRFEPMVREEILAVAPRTFQLGRGRELPLAEVIRTPIIFISAPAFLRSYIDRVFDEKGLSVQEKFEVTNVRTMLDFAEAGLGTALIPAANVPVPLMKNVQGFRLVEPVLERTICCVTLRGSTPVPFTASLIARIREVLSNDKRFKPISP